MASRFLVVRVENKRATCSPSVSASDCNPGAMRENFKKTCAVADMQEQSQPPIPRGHCQSRHDKFPHARIAHSGPPITASAPREKNGAASSFQSPCKSVRNPFPNPARARRHRRENRPNVWNNASYIGFSAESPNLYAAYPQIPTFRFLARPKAFYAFFALGSNN